MEIKYEIKSYLFCFIVESTVVRSEMEVVLLYDNYVQVSLRGRRLKGKEKEKNNCLQAGVSLPPPSTRAPRVSLAPKTPFPFPFKRLPRRLRTVSYTHLTLPTIYSV